MALAEPASEGRGTRKVTAVCATGNRHSHRRGISGKNIWDGVSSDTMAGGGAVRQGGGGAVRQGGGGAVRQGGAVRTQPCCGRAGQSPCLLAKKKIFFFDFLKFLKSIKKIFIKFDKMEKHVYAQCAQRETTTSIT